jgi:hypothetical protein
MSRQRFLAVIGLLGLISSPSLGQSVGDPVTQVESFLKAFYPQVTATRARIVLSVETSSHGSSPWYVVVEKLPVEYQHPAAGEISGASPCLSVDPPGACEVQRLSGIPMLRGRVDFFKGRIIRYHGNLLELSQRNFEFQKLLQANPGWGDDEIKNALSAKGAQFGPMSRKQLLRSVPWERVRRAIGNFKIVETTFELYRPHNPTPEPWVLPGVFWFVRAESANMRFTMQFEPFQGRLYMFTVRPKTDRNMGTK